ncbi:MAG: hypothetical protein ACE5NM_07325 [Sedimentisphaerales bacterium]
MKRAVSSPADSLGQTGIIRGSQTTVIPVKLVPAEAGSENPDIGCALGPPNAI